jgi:hypothetical protein
MNVATMGEFSICLGILPRWPTRSIRTSQAIYIFNEVVLSMCKSLCSLLLLLLTSPALALNTYMIGNSLTNDGLGNVIEDVSGLENMAQNFGNDLTLGYHIDSSQSLNNIWANPNGVGGVDLSNVGYYSQALPELEWDAVVLQPYEIRGISKLETDKQSIDNFVNLTRQNSANSDTTFYIYQVWPSQFNYATKSFSDYWNQEPLDNEDQRPTEMMRSYYRELMADLIVEQPTVNFRMIPTGEVFNRLSLLDLPGMVFEDFYRDPYHMSFDMGRYVASATIFATLFGEDVRSYTPSSTYHSIDQSVLDTINQVVYEEVKKAAADLNFDGIIDVADLARWNAGYENSWYSGRDFFEWQRQYSDSNIPEPSTMVLLILGLTSHRLLGRN